MRVLSLIAGLGLAACSPGDGAARSSDQAAPVPESASAGPPSERRAFRDWIAICDNGNACFAFGRGVDGFGWIRVALEPGPDARPEVAAGLWPDETPANGQFGLTIDGADYPMAPVDSERPAATVSAARALEAARALADGDSARIGPDQALSLSGAAAALLWIDERQGRVGTVTALRRAGVGPASDVPAAPPLPIVTPAPVAAQAGFGDQGQTLPAAVAALPAVTACRADTGDHPVTMVIMSARLDASNELWAVPCFVGAYNIGHDWYITGPGGRDPRAARLTSTTSEASAGTINGGYAPDSRTLTAFAKGRGIGDCGTASTWTWTGREFVLTSEQAMTECWGVPLDYWPTTWRTR